MTERDSGTEKVQGPLVYLTNMTFDAVDMAPWETADDRGMLSTAVPVKHNSAGHLHEKNLDSRVTVLEIGEQCVVMAK